MSTVVAIETPTGVAIAGDTRVVDGGTVSSDRFQRVFDLGGVGIGVTGKSAAVQEFWRSFEVALRDRGLEISDTPDIDAVARIAARETEKASVDARGRRARRRHRRRGRRLDHRERGPDHPGRPARRRGGGAVTDRRPTKRGGIATLTVDVSSTSRSTGRGSAATGESLGW